MSCCGAAWAHVRARASPQPTIKPLARKLGELQKGRARVQQQLDALPGMARWQNVEVKDRRQTEEHAYRATLQGVQQLDSFVCIRISSVAGASH